MFPFMRKKNRCSYDLSIEHDLQTQDASSSNSHRSSLKRESFTYYGLDTPVKEGNPEAHLDYGKRQSLIREQSPASIGSKSSGTHSEKSPDRESTTVSNAEEKDSSGQTCAKLAEAKEEETAENKSTEELNAKVLAPDVKENSNGNKNDSLTYTKTEQNEADTKDTSDSKENDKSSKKEPRPSLLEEFLAETSNLSISSHDCTVEGNEDVFTKSDS